MGIAVRLMMPQTWYRVHIDQGEVIPVRNVTKVSRSRIWWREKSRYEVCGSRSEHFQTMQEAVGAMVADLEKRIQEHGPQPSKRRTKQALRDLNRRLEIMQNKYREYL